MNAVNSERVLTPEGRLPSDLWIDRPDAIGSIERLRATGRIDETQARNLGDYVEKGYCVLDLDLPEATLQSIDEDVERLWRERPRDVAVAYRGLLKPMSDADPAQDRRPSCRIADLHGSSEAALDLYLHPEVFRYLRLIFDEIPVATQSLYFQWGSQQQLHRDPVHVQMQPPSHLAAIWFALEDLAPGCGPLTYVPGSHRLPYYEIEPGEYRLDAYRHGDAEAEAMARFDLETCQRHGLEVHPFLGKRGQALLWHHSLLHGGSYPEDPELTRKSFVVHFTTMRQFERAAHTVMLPPRGGGDTTPTPRPVASFEVLARDRCYGFESPLKVGSDG